MLHKRSKFTCIGLMLVLLLLPGLACGSSKKDDITIQTGTPQGETVQLIEKIATASSDAQQIEAINAVVEQGGSLGLLDEDGQQLNPNVAADAVSLTPEDVESFAAFTEIGQYSTVGDVVNYLAEIGVVLGKTGEVITLEDFLVDLQSYVNWSFYNSDDPDSQLGILIASGPDMQPPDAIPTIEGGTQISIMAAVLMLGDILIGKEETQTTAWNWLVKPVYADDLQQTAERIKGYITYIESYTKPAEKTIDHWRGWLEKKGLMEKSSEPTKILKIPDAAKQIIGAFAMGSHFGIRLHEFKSTASLSASEMPVLRSFELSSEGQHQNIVPSLVLVPGDKNAPVVVLEEEIPVMYTFRLLSPGEVGVGTDLYPDANAVLATSAINIISDTAGGQHILEIASSNEKMEGVFSVEATKLHNLEPRVALLHASASILTGNLAEQFEKYRLQYGDQIKALGLQPADLAEMFGALQAAVKVSPWMTQVVLKGGRQVRVDPVEMFGKPNYGYKFTAAVDNPPASYQWEWQVAYRLKDGTEKKIDMSVNKEATAIISFPEPGEYEVTAYLRDGTAPDAQIIGSASSVAVIKEETEKPSDIELNVEAVTGPPYETGCSIRFIAKPSVGNDKLPEKIRWEWNWWDGDPVDKVEGQPQANKLNNESSHVYKSSDNYYVEVALYDAATDTLLATGSTTAYVDDIAAIQRTKWVRAMLYCGRTEQIENLENGNISSGRESFGWLGENSRGQKDGLVWKGNEFSVTWKSSSGTTTYTISGKVSEDASMVETITAREDFLDPATGATIKESLTLTGVPLKKGNCGENVVFKVLLTGVEEIKKYAPQYKYESRNPNSITTFTGFAWDFQADTPKLEVEFSAME